MRHDVEQRGRCVDCLRTPHEKHLLKRQPREVVPAHNVATLDGEDEGRDRWREPRDLDHLIQHRAHLVHVARSARADEEGVVRYKVLAGVLPRGPVHVAVHVPEHDEARVKVGCVHARRDQRRECAHVRVHVRVHRELKQAERCWDVAHLAGSVNERGERVDRGLHLGSLHLLKALGRQVELLGLAQRVDGDVECDDVGAPWLAESLHSPEDVKHLRQHAVPLVLGGEPVPCDQFEETHAMGGHEQVLGTGEVCLALLCTLPGREVDPHGEVLTEDLLPRIIA